MVRKYQKKMLLFFILMMKNLALKTALQLLWQNQTSNNDNILLELEKEKKALLKSLRDIASGFDYEEEIKTIKNEKKKVFMKF